MIFKELERINPNFYPVPVKSTIDKLDPRLKQDGYLKKDKAIKVYKSCGGYLHATNPFKSQR
ncbi:MAG: hypothetical protein AAGA64_15890, partial [Bacteroidota bacterium]